MVAMGSIGGRVYILWFLWVVWVEGSFLKIFGSWGIFFEKKRKIRLKIMIFGWV